MSYITLAEQAMGQQYTYQRTARSMLSTAHPKTGEISTAVQLAMGHPVEWIEKTIEELLSRGIAEETKDPQVIRLKSVGGK